ncbi:MAG: carbon-nitrogen hydrolase family protein [Actinobacteria bacterium]|nr:carbon-nitrogen hydrolase family protein [Actinomycetota bacterium]
MREITAAAVQVAPSSQPLTVGSIKNNGERALELVRACHAATGADLIVLPESVTTGFTPGIDTTELWDLVDDDIRTPYHRAARELGIHLVFGSYERAPERGIVYNAAYVVGPDGHEFGTYRKTHPFGSERADRGGWVTPGDDILVVSTEIGRIGVIICFDGDYPELARITAIEGAEIICRPSALLRSADLWELTNRARAYDNHVYVIGSNATGVDPAQVIYFGNSMIVTPIAEVVARAASHECWISARLDPAKALASLTPGSSVAQPFDHLEDRNLEVINRHAAALLGEARTSFARGAD